MKLKSYQSFEASISPLLAALSRKSRAAIVKKVYALAVEKGQMEDLKIGLVTQAKVLRKRRLKLSQVRAHIKNARKEPMAANSSYPQELPRAVDMQSVVEKLDEMAERIRSIEKTLAGIVHPQLRTAVEERSPGPTPQWGLPGLKNTAIEYWFISALDVFFDTLTSEHNVILGPTQSISSAAPVV
jgi:hypothetical protein